MGLQSITGKCVCSNAALQAVFNCSVPVGYNAGVLKLTLTIISANAGGGKTKHNLCANTCIVHFAHSHLLLFALSVNTLLKREFYLAFGTRTCLVASV